MRVIQTYINLDDCEVPESASKPMSWMDGLTTNDKEVRIKGGWLINDKLINTGQQLIKRQFSQVSGLQDVAI